MYLVVMIIFSIQDEILHLDKSVWIHWKMSKPNTYLSTDSHW